MRMAMPASSRSWLVTPDIRAGVREPGLLAELGDVASGLALLMRPRGPVDVLRAIDRNGIG
jgi:hypothetical protein